MPGQASPNIRALLAFYLPNLAMVSLRRVPPPYEGGGQGEVSSDTPL